MKQFSVLTAAAVAAASFAGVSSALGVGRMIAVDSSRALYEIDIATGAKTLIGTVSANAGTTAGLAYNPGDGTLYLTSTSNDSLYTLDLATGNATLVGSYGDSAVVMHGLEFVSLTGELFGGSSHNGGLYKIDQATGAASLVGTSGLTSFTNYAYNSATNVMYATNSNTDSSYTVNLSNGQMTLIGALTGPTNPNGLAYNTDDGRVYFVDNSTDNLYVLDTATGAAVLVGSTGTGNLLGLAYVTEIPEPGSLGLLAAAGAVALRRRARQHG